MSVLAFLRRANRGDLQRREGLAVARLAAIALAALVLEDDDLLPQALLQDLGLDRDARHGRAAHLDLAGVVSEQQRAEGDLRARRTVELLDAQGLPLGDAILFSTRCDDGVHDERKASRAPALKGSARGNEGR